jgi:branched-chain amino acid transport system ATP-binding protein
LTLRADEVSVRFGGVRAVERVSLSLGPGEILGLVGPNGAGKTTMVNVLSGFQRPTGGRVEIGGRPAGRSPERLARQGVVRTFQAVRLFHGISVSENVEVGLANLGLGRRAARRRAMELLDYMGLADKAGHRGDALAYGDERRVGIARALSLSPRFLLLDEPAAGLTPAEAAALAAVIRRIRDDFGAGVLVIEHNMRMVRDLCERLHVMASGRTIAEGGPAEVMASDSFRSAYLGEEALP